MKTALITGASSGIGKALAEKLSENGCKVIVVARRGERLVELARSFQNIQPITCDLSQVEGRAKLIESVTDKIDYLIHNAGIEAHIDNIEGLTEVSLQEIIQINLIAPMILTAQLKAKGLLHPQSRVLSVSSRAGDQAFRGVGAYGVTKAGLDAFTRALVEENYLAATVVPGEVDTQIQKNLREASFPLQQFFIDAKKEGRLLDPSVTARFIYFLLCKMENHLFTGKKHNIYDRDYWNEWLGEGEFIQIPEGEKESNMKTRLLG